jgi:hypothetical protein
LKFICTQKNGLILNLQYLLKKIAVNAKFYDPEIKYYKSDTVGWAQWLTYIIPDIQEVKTGRIWNRGQPRQKVSETPIRIHKLGMELHCYNPTGGIGWRTGPGQTWTKPLFEK